MNTELIPLDQIVANPFRDLTVYPLDPSHVAELQRSIGTHGFFGGVKARRRNGKVETACGHYRMEAARAAGLTAVELFIDDISDDDMVRLMADENATQVGDHPAAVLNDVAAVTRRLVEVLIGGNLAGIPARSYFDGERGLETARGQLLARVYDPNAKGGLGWLVIMRYLGRGNEKDSSRSKQQIIDATTTLKQTGLYDKIVDEAVRKHMPPIPNFPMARGKALKANKPVKSKPRVLDERTASLFPVAHQFLAFREAVTTEAAKKAIPVEEQYALAVQITKAPNESQQAAGFRKQLTAPLIKTMVEGRVRDYWKAQRGVDKEERDRAFAEQLELKIDAQLDSAKKQLRAMLSAVAKLDEIARTHPGDPIVVMKIGGFSAKLDSLIGMIQQLSARFKTHAYERRR